MKKLSPLDRQVRSQPKAEPSAPLLVKKKGVPGSEPLWTKGSHKPPPMVLSPPEKHVPVKSSGSALPVVEQQQGRPRVSERLTTPPGPGGMSIRDFCLVLQFGSGHAEALACVGDQAMVERLREAGLDGECAKVWRQFFSDIARISHENGVPNPSAAGRAVMMDWVATQFGEPSVGVPTLAKWLASDPRNAGVSETGLTQWLATRTGVDATGMAQWLAEGAA